jgi:hypothetical protein
MEKLAAFYLGMFSLNFALLYIILFATLSIKKAGGSDKNSERNEAKTLARSKVEFKK